MKKHSCFSHTLIKAVALSFALFVTVASQSFAQTWTGTNSGAWNDSGNWGGTAPTTGTAIVFTGAANPVTNNDISSLTTGAITFNAGTAANFTLGGNSIVLGGNLTTAALTAGGPFNHLINIGMQLNGNRQFNAANSHSLTLNGAITEDATPRSVTRGTGGGTITWNGANTFTGTLTLNGGGANNFSSIADSGSSSIGIGSGNIAFSGANNQFAFINGTAPGATARNITIGTSGNPGDAVSIFSSSATANALTLSGNVTNGTAAKVFVLGGSNTGANLASGVISNGAGGVLSFNKTNPGTWTLSGVNTFSGSATVTGGTLRASTVGLADMNTGTASNLGAGSSIVLAGGTLNFNNSGTDSNVVSNRSLDLRGNATISSDNGAGIDFTGGTFTASSSTPALANRQLTLRGNSNQTNKIGLVISDVGSGFVTSVVKNDAGTWELTGANTHTGKTQILNGTLRATTLGNVGATSSNLGAQTTAANATIDFGNASFTGTLDYRGSGETTNRVVNLNGTTGGGAIDHEGSGVLRFTSDMTATVAGTKTLTLSGTGVAAGKRGEFAGVIVDSSGGATTLTKADSGRWALQGTNTYTGVTNINNGFLEVATIGNQGVASNLGAGTTIGFGQGTANGTLEYVGSGETTNRIVDLRTANTGGGRIDNNGTGALVLTADTVHTGSVAAKTLTLGGTSTGFVNEFDGVINDQAGGLAVGVTKAGASTWSLGGVNTYTGATVVNEGTLLVNGSTSTGAMSVDAGATLGGSGTIGGSTTIFGTHAPGNSPGVQTFLGNLSYTGGASIVQWELTNNSVNNSPLIFDQISVGGNLDFVGATSLSLDFGTSSSVNWANSFWDTDKVGTAGWLLFDVTGTTNNFGNLAIAPNSWLDGSSQTFATVRPNASFSLFQDGSDVFLNYSVTAIPEPSSCALIGLAGIAAAIHQRRRKANEAKSAFAANPSAYR